MNQNQTEGERWLAQARFDLAAAAHNAAGGFPALACFLAQQAAEKALKAFLYARGQRAILGHSSFLLLRKCIEYKSGLDSLGEVCRQLDQFYITTRYPNGLPGGIPHEMFSRGQAETAIEGARTVIEQVETALPPAS